MDTVALNAVLEWLDECLGIITVPAQPEPTRQGDRTMTELEELLEGR